MLLFTLLELLDAGTLLRLLEVAGVLDAGMLEVEPPSTPQGAGNAAQLVRPTQLCWFSQPQPEAWLTQIG